MYQLQNICIYKAIQLICLSEARDISTECFAETVEKGREKSAQNIHGFRARLVRHSGQAELNVISRNYPQGEENYSGKEISEYELSRGSEHTATDSTVPATSPNSGLLPMLVYLSLSGGHDVLHDF